MSPNVGSIHLLPQTQQHTMDITKINSPQQPKPRKLLVHNVVEKVPTSDKPLATLKATTTKKELQMVDNDMEKASGQEDVKFDNESE